MEADLQALVRRTLDENRYMVLGTSGPDGTARVSPVYFTHVDTRTLYRAVARTHELHVRGSDPTYGTGVDTRLAVEMP